jgi:hypothetical protein
LATLYYKQKNPWRRGKRALDSPPRNRTIWALMKFSDTAHGNSDMRVNSYCRHCDTVTEWKARRGIECYIWKCMVCGHIVDVDFIDLDPGPPPRE